MRTNSLIAALGAVFSISACVSGQEQTLLPHDATTQSPVDKPLTAEPVPRAPDDEFELLKQFVAGSFLAAADGDRPALVLHAVPVKIIGLPDTLIVEIARADSPADPFRVYFLRSYRRQGELRFRALELPGGSGLAEAIAGLWAATDTMPVLDAASLTSSLDLPVKLNNSPGRGGSFLAKSEHRFLTNRGGAIEMTATMYANPGSLQLLEAGFDANGKQVWGTSADKPSIFKRVVDQPLVRREPTGVIIITTIPPKPDAPKLEPGGEVVLHYTSWLTNGQKLNSSRDPGAQPAKVRVPGGVLPGLNAGLDGIAKGERRKVILPPAMAYGERGQGAIPPNSTVIVDVECIFVDNSNKDAPPPATMNPHAPRPAAATPQPAPGGEQPIGSPPTNGTPESPR